MGGYTVLVVDDEAQIRALVRSVLIRKNYSVIVASDGIDALARYEESGKVDLLLTDIVMPGMDGIQLAERLWSRDQRLAVLYMSGKCEMDAVQRHVTEKGFGFLRKPFQIEGLLGKVAELIQARATKKSPKTAVENSAFPCKKRVVANGA